MEVIGKGYTMYEVKYTVRLGNFPGANTNKQAGPIERTRQHTGQRDRCLVRLPRPVVHMHIVCARVLRSTTLRSEPHVARFLRLDRCSRD